MSNVHHFDLPTDSRGIFISFSINGKILGHFGASTDAGGLDQGGLKADRPSDKHVCLCLQHQDIEKVGWYENGKKGSFYLYKARWSVCGWVGISAYIPVFMMQGTTCWGTLALTAKNTLPPSHMTIVSTRSQLYTIVLAVHHMILGGGGFVWETSWLRTSSSYAWHCGNL